MQTTSYLHTLAFLGSLLTAASGFGQSGPPVITQNPAGLTILAGQTATFSVAATNGPFTYQWQSGPVGGGTFNNLSDGGQISDSSGPSLVVSNVTPANAADFRVVVANGQSAVTSSVATLTVQISYTVNVPSGLSLIANQLDHGSNTVDEIMPSVPDGSILYKFINAATNWSPSYYSTALGAWTPRGISLNPGEGAFFQSPTNFTLTFTGTPHVPVLPVSIPVGACYLLSRQTNDIGNYTNIVGTAPTNHAVIYQWNGSGYAPVQYAGGTWTSGGSAGPTAAIGEALWIAPTGGSGPAPLAVPPFMVSTPQPTMVIGVGSNAVLSASFSGLGPLSYQWYKDGVAIAGATPTTLTIANATYGDTGYYSLGASNVFGITYTLPTLLRVAEMALAGGMAPADFGDMPSTNWSCWETSYFDPNDNCAVKSIYSKTESIPPVIYPTTLALNGARNSWTSGVDMTWLGTDVSPTVDGVPNAVAMGDPGGTNLLVTGFPNTTPKFGDVFTPAGYLKEENGIRMIPCPYAFTTSNQIYQPAGFALGLPLMVDPRFDTNGLPGKNLFGSAGNFFAPGEDPGYRNVPNHSGRQCFSAGQILWFTIEAYNKDAPSNYANGVSYLNAWLDYGNSNGPAGLPDGVFQPDEYVLIDQPLYGADMLEYLSTIADPPFDTGGTVRNSSIPVAQALAQHYGLAQPLPSIGVQPYASNGLQVASFSVPPGLGPVSCMRSTFARFRISAQPLNLWRDYDPADGSAHVLDPVSWPAPSGPGMNTYGLWNTSGQPDPSVGEITGGGEVEDYPVCFSGSCNPLALNGPSFLCAIPTIRSESITTSGLPLHPPTTSLDVYSFWYQTFIEVTVANNWPPVPFTIQVTETNGNYELMVVTSAPIGKHQLWTVERNTPSCTTNMNFDAGSSVVLAAPCQCQLNNRVPLPSGLVNVSAVDPGAEPCYIPHLPFPASPGWAPTAGWITLGPQDYPDQFMFANVGSNILTGITITYTIPTNAFLESAAADAGTVTPLDNTVAFSLGELDPGQVSRIGIKIVPLADSGPSATFLHHFDFAADQALLGATSYEMSNTVQIQTLLSIVPGAAKQATLLWLTNDPAVILQQESSLAGPWTVSPIQSAPYVIPATNPAQFFRLTR